MARRVYSVLELAKYRPGDKVWWIILRPLHNPPTLDDNNKWMSEYHPKVFYDRKICKFPNGAKIPKLQHIDFKNITDLITSKLVAEEFVICDICRSTDTGEFFYSNKDNEWIPECNVMDTKSSAEKELSRIMSLLYRWIVSQE